MLPDLFSPIIACTVLCFSNSFQPVGLPLRIHLIPSWVSSYLILPLLAQSPKHLVTYQFLPSWPHSLSLLLSPPPLDLVLPVLPLPWQSPKHVVTPHFLPFLFPHLSPGRAPSTWKTPPG